MKTNAQLTMILILLSLVLFLCIVFDFLALHDIYRDYVSKLVMNRFSPTISNTLPNWTNTEGEWAIVQISLFIKFLLIGITFLILFTFRKNLPKGQ
jgi:hypothetical protein